VNKALVTQASSAIPVVPLYISLLYKVMKEQGSHEDCIEQMDRLFRERYTEPQPDEAGRIRLDDWEMDPKVQQPVIANWHKVTSENLKDLADLEGYQSSFLRLFGFGLEGVDYDADTDTAAKVASIG
jgi:enoyl-[acyl-carrier protein] reductase/trans-2-enoyl-CoA reductase (NAD+)